MTEQRNEEWLKAATPDQIVAAFEAGELDDLQGVTRNELGNRPDQLRGISR